MVVSMHLSASVCNLHGLTFCLLPSQYGPAPLQKALLDNLKPNRTCLTQHSSALTHAPPPPCETVQVNKCRWFVCVCVFCFGPPAFFLFMHCHFHLLSQPSTPHSFPKLAPFLAPSLCSGSAGVHMIKQGTRVITWHCQIKRPLIQMRSEISKTGIAFAATTYPHRRQRGDLRARGPAGRQQQHSAFPSWINITNGSNRAKHAQVH